MNIFFIHVKILAWSHLFCVERAQGLSRRKPGESPGHLLGLVAQKGHVHVAKDQI